MQTELPNLADQQYYLDEFEESDTNATPLATAQHSHTKSEDDKETENDIYIFRWGERLRMWA